MVTSQPHPRSLTTRSDKERIVELLTGMLMNKAYTFGTYVEMINEHIPVIPIYNDSVQPKQLRINRHKTPAIPIQTEEWGKRHLELWIALSSKSKVCNKGLLEVPQGWKSSSKYPHLYLMKYWPELDQIWPVVACHTSETVRKVLNGYTKRVTSI